MARLAKIEKGRWDQFDRMVSGTVSAEEISKLVQHPDVWDMMLERMRQHPAFKLIHGVFNTQVDVLAAFKARLAEKGIDFGRFSWVGPEAAPDFDPDDPETVVLLDATLDTLKATFEFAWEWMQDGQEANWRWPGMVSDADKLRLLSDERPDEAEGDGTDFQPWTLSWRRIKLDTNIGEKLEDVRNAKSPGCALLFMSAEHPARIKATDYKTRFGFWLAGLKCTAPGEGPWRSVPRVDLRLDLREVRLGASPCDGASGRLAVPSLRE